MMPTNALVDENISLLPFSVHKIDWELFLGQFAFDQCNDAPIYSSITFFYDGIFKFKYYGFNSTFEENAVTHFIDV